jgi:hypothetical protein
MTPPAITTHNVIAREDVNPKIQGEAISQPPSNVTVHACREAWLSKLAKATTTMTVPQIERFQLAAEDSL